MEREKVERSENILLLLKYDRHQSKHMQQKELMLKEPTMLKRKIDS